MTEPVSAARVVVLISGSGSNLQALLDASADPAYGAQVVAVGADRDGIAGLDRAAAAGVPTFVDRVQGLRRPGTTWDARARPRTSPSTSRTWWSRPASSSSSARTSSPPSATATSTRTTRCCPPFPGIHGPRDALAYGVKIAGATLFFVDAGVDTGPIIAQVAVPVLDDDTRRRSPSGSRSPSARQLVEQVGRLVREGWTITGRKVTIP